MSSTIDTETLYESISSNRNDNNISSKSHFLLFSRCLCPIIWNLTSNKVEAFLSGHQAEVIGQHFVDDLTDNISIISTSHDKTAIIWQFDKILHQFRSPDDNFFATSCSIRMNENFYSITTTIEGNIYYWKDAKLLQTIKVDYCCLSSKLLSVNSDLTLLFLSGSDNKIYIFQLSTLNIKYLFSLKGYNDWVKCLDVLRLPQRSNEFLLATASQDTLVRIWHLKLLVNQKIDSTQIRTIVSEPLTTSGDVIRLSATLETILSGHTGFVQSLCWVKKPEDPTNLQLFTCSADKTIILWQSKIATLVDAQSPASQGVWNELQRFGETGETNLPFLGVCLADNDEKTLFALSLRGAIHCYNQEENNPISWVAVKSITGHFDSITDLSWDKSGSYLLSSSLDKTCRLHSLINIDNKWHEFARPQVHGHEINCIASLDFCKFASGAEEKTIRTFGATQFFLKNYKHMAGCAAIDLDKLISVDRSTLPAHAQLPALGLSNRGASSPYEVVSSGDNPKESKDAAAGWNEISNLVRKLAEVDHLKELPHEDILLQSTLWWETNKIFGHCNELYALASDSSGKFLASASKANRVDMAKIIIWETEKFRQVASIEHHSLTITRLRFSPDDRLLLSVSRDRTWSLSKKTGQLRNAYKLICKSNSVHERIIWDCCWTYDSKYFMTVSRDKRAMFWNADDLISNEIQKEEATQTITANACATSKLFNCSIQAVDSPPPGQEVAICQYFFVFGFESGTIELHTICKDPSAPNLYQWVCLRSFIKFHQLSIRRLAFRPNPRSEQQQQKYKHKHEYEQQQQEFVLASGADDCVLKLTKFVLTN